MGELTELGKIDFQIKAVKKQIDIKAQSMASLDKELFELRKTLIQLEDKYQKELERQELEIYDKYIGIYLIEGFN